LLSGIARNDVHHKESNDEDFDMDGTQNDDQEEEDGDGEEAPQTQITIVNERDIEGVLHYPQCAVVSLPPFRSKGFL